MGDDLPDGKTCKDCVHYAPTCSWLLGGYPLLADSTRCDWSPSRFRLLQLSPPEEEARRG